MNYSFYFNMSLRVIFLFQKLITVEFIIHGGYYFLMFTVDLN